MPKKIDRLYGLTAEEWLIALHNLELYWKEKEIEIEKYASQN